ncbi:MAG TPA: hypothetical protein VMZ29_14090 [Candidatus Bathyarchaeia archaeon]|nr:hypothetical protein [Candidatus Bathyarchaeia archaeon]
MKKKYLVLLLLISSFILVLRVNFLDTSAAKVQGLYTTLTFNNELFPDYEPLELSFFIKRTDALDLNKSSSFFITSYRLVLNKTLLAYVDYRDTPEKFIPELEVRELSFDHKDFELNFSDYDVQHKMILQVTSITVDSEGNEKSIADDYLTVEVLFLREATTSEVLIIFAIVFIPLLLFSSIFFIRQAVNNYSVENVTMRNLFTHSFKLIKRRFSKGDAHANKSYKYTRLSEGLQNRPD